MNEDVCSHCRMTFGLQEKRVRFEEFIAHEGCIRKAVRFVKKEVQDIVTRLKRRRVRLPQKVYDRVRMASNAEEVYFLLEELYLVLNNEASLGRTGLAGVLVRLQEFSEAKLLRPLPKRTSLYDDAETVLLRRIIGRVVGHAQRERATP